MSSPDQKSFSPPAPAESPSSTAAQIGGAALEVGASMIPGVGEAMDVYTLLAADSTLADRGLSVVSLGANLLTAGLLPNFGGWLKAGRKVAKAADKSGDVAKSADKAKDAANKANDVGTKSARKPPSTHQKAAFGEKKAHEAMNKRGKRIDQGGDYKPGQNGIDGVYKNHSPPPDYTIMEAKYDTSKLGTTKDGRQMSDAWIDGRLDKAVGKVEADKIRDSMLAGKVDRVVVNVKPDGSAVMRPVDSVGKYIK